MYCYLSLVSGIWTLSLCVFGFWALSLFLFLINFLSRNSIMPRSFFLISHPEVSVPKDLSQPPSLGHFWCFFSLPLASERDTELEVMVLFQFPLYYFDQMQLIKLPDSDLEILISHTAGIRIVFWESKSIVVSCLNIEYFSGFFSQNLPSCFRNIQVILLSEPFVSVIYSGQFHSFVIFECFAEGDTFELGVKTEVRFLFLFEFRYIYRITEWFG